MLDAKGGEGLSMLDLGGALHLGGAYDLFLMIYFFWLFMGDTLCIHVYFHALNYIRVIVILM